MSASTPTIDRFAASDAQQTAADFFMEGWRMFTSETLPWAGFDRNVIMIAVQERTAKLYAEARRRCGIVDAVAIEHPPKRTCNKHNDCDAAQAKARAEGRNPYVICCHSDDCEECFGS